VSQAIEGAALRDAGQPSSQDESKSLVRILFDGLENDPDFIQVSERWAGLSAEIREVILRMVKQV